MIQEEFINSIVNGNISSYNGIIAIAEEQKSIKDLLSSLFAKVVQLDTENVVLCETDKGTLVNTDITIEQETKRERVMKAMGYIESYFGISLFDVFDDVPEGTETKLPEELNTDEAKKYFQCVIDLGFMDNNYKWLGGLQTCAYFASKMSDKLKLGKGERISWRRIEALFGVPKGKLRSNLNDVFKTGGNPKNIKLIKNIFE